METRPIAELTVNEVATQAGVNRSGFYFYFETKFATLAVLASDAWASLLQEAHGFRRLDGENVEEYLERIARSSAATWKSNSAVLVATVQALPLDDQLAAMWRDHIGRLAELITRQVRADQSHGHAFPAAADTAGLVSLLIEMTMHSYYTRCLEHSSPDRDIPLIVAIWRSALWGQSSPV